jgi:hypothetical protein
MPELEIGLDKVCFFIVKAKEFDVKEAVVEEDYGSSAIDDDFRGVLETYADDPVFQELKDYIDGLNSDEKAELVALAWLGRGDFSADEWAEAVRTAHARHTGRTSLYLLGMPTLADYLEEGLDALGLSCVDIQAGDLAAGA